MMFAVCIFLGVGAFVAVRVITPSNQQAVAPPAVLNPAPVIDTPATPTAVLPKVDHLIVPNPIVQLGKKDPATVPVLHRASYKSWKLPAPENLTGLDKGLYDVKEITMSADGTRALVKSKREVHCLDLTTGQIKQTFQPAKPLWDYQKPETNLMFLAPDASCVIVGSQSKSADKRTELKKITVYDATSGKVGGSAALDERSDMYGFANTAVFTPHGEYLLLPTFHYRDGLFMQAVATSTGAVRMVNLAAQKDHVKSWDLTVTVPQEPKLFLSRRGGTKDNPSGVTSMDLSTGIEKPIRALTVDPWNLFNRGVQLSADGKLLMSQGIKELQVCDWHSDKRLFDLRRDQLNHGRFTPDCKRVLVEWAPQFRIIRIGGPKGGIENVPTGIELYDIANQTKIAEFTLEKHGLALHVNALTISDDGKTLAWASGTSVIVIDFKEAFGLEPLPPASRPAGPDLLPLK